MTSMFAAWRRRSDPERFDTYTRWSLYLMLAVVPFIAFAVAPAAPALGSLYLALAVAECVAAIVVLRRALDGALGGQPVPGRWLAGLAAVTAAAAVVAVAAVPADGEESMSVRAVAVLAALGVPLLAVAPMLSTGRIVAASLVVAAGTGLAELGPAGLQRVIPATISGFLVTVGLALSFRVSAWMLGVVWEQERARAVHARLAVAEERLRFSRDLHDVMGRTLSAIAVKSELGAELARRGHDGAAGQMLEVRELAADALREIRGVVAGYREADLAAELAGARSVLRSAGVQTRVVGDGSGLPVDVQQALAWVVREGATNVVRHADATTCTFDLAAVHGAAGAVARLRIVNDGARPAHGGSGSGLLGLGERLAVVGGRLSTSREGPVFTLEATVPLDAAPADVPPGRGRGAGRMGPP